MRNVLIIICLFTSIGSFGQAKECRTNLQVDAIFEKIENKVNTTVSTAKIKERNDRLVFVDLAATSPIIYRLNSSDKSYTVISFLVMAELESGDILEANCLGNTLNGWYNAMKVLREKKKDTPLFFYCIKVKNKTGAIFVLKPLTVNL
jgi:hypothetical protein